MSLWTSCQIFLYLKLSQATIIYYLQQHGMTTLWPSKTCWSNKSESPIDKTVWKFCLIRRTPLIVSMPLLQNIRIRCVFLSIPAASAITANPPAHSIYCLQKTHCSPDSFIGSSNLSLPSSTCLMNEWISQEKKCFVITEFFWVWTNLLCDSRAEDSYKHNQP